MSLQGLGVDYDEGGNGKQDNAWKLDKHVPLSLIAAMAVQTVLFAAWLSSNMSEIRAELRTASVRIEEIWRDRYTKDDARRDAEFVKLRDEEITRRIDDVERRLRPLEAEHGSNGHGVRR
jgi:hypothetical protein